MQYITTRTAHGAALVVRGADCGVDGPPGRPGRAAPPRRSPVAQLVGFVELIELIEFVEFVGAYTSVDLHSLLLTNISE
jgi:hypothetical protein